MRYLILTGALVAALAGLPTPAMVAPATAAPAATLKHHTRNCPSAAEINRMAAAGSNMVPGFAQYLESCAVHRRIRRAFKDCMVGFGIGAVVGAIGGIITQAGARAIACSMISAAAGGCIESLR
jgi:uncharacterized membrane protein YfcA